MKRLVLGKLLFGLTLLALHAAPSDRQVAADASRFHRFRISVLARATDIDRRNHDNTAAMKYLGEHCAELARQTSPEFLFGVVEDLIQDQSRTEEPYLIAITVLDNYPPDEARRVVKEIIANPKYQACMDVKNWLWEIDEAQKRGNTASVFAPRSRSFASRATRS